MNKIFFKGRLKTLSSAQCVDSIFDSMTSTRDCPAVAFLFSKNVGIPRRLPSAPANGACQTTW